MIIPAEPVRLVIFDCDGVLVDSERIAAGMRAFRYAGGLTPAARLTGPDTVVFEDMRELPALLAPVGR
ncbi:hypothetical protein OG196_30680 [Kitasatospora purpeofusca]|uniref:hypothetical protein n=1 Tax=Kitasatospora purpeofusca TaxID=67352 RepID=UPI002E0DB29E|nr:hypothetical protein OG196_30680 [Kitasatospora purpeofusca]